MNDENFKINYENNIKQFINILLPKINNKIEELLRPNEGNTTLYKQKYDKTINHIRPLKDDIIKLVNTNINDPEVYKKIEDLITYFCEKINRYFYYKSFINGRKSGLQDKFKEIYKILLIIIKKN